MGSEQQLAQTHRRQDLPGEVSYYGLPPVKHSHYHWKTALSFLSEALGGAPQVIAAVIHLSGNGRDYSLVRAGRYLALVSSFTSPGLLISELHVPRRWYNMLRIFRSTSSMSIGNMSLTAFGIFSGLTAAGQMLEDLGHEKKGRAMSRIFSIPAAAAGGMLCLYPGTELEKTCTPMWAASYPLLSPLFAATGLSAGAAALTVAAQCMTVSEKGRDRLNRFSILALGVQLAGTLLVEIVWRKRMAVHSFKHFSHAFAYRFGVLGIGILLPLVIRLAWTATGRRLPKGEVAASAATLAGCFLLYEVILEAGNESAAQSGKPLDYSRAGQLQKINKPEDGGISIRRGAIGFSLLAAAGMAYFLWNRRAHR